jgi:nicotinamide-nucleotide amidase
VLKPLASAEIIAVGTEMLGPDRTDTNSLHIAQRLDALGIPLKAKHIVGDDLEMLTASIADALDRVDLVLLTGGLGPTDDDLTRPAVARVLGREVREDEAIAQAIRARFERRGMSMPEINRRQAQIIEGATPLANPNGTAPGQWIEHGSRVLVLLPGPPREMLPMLDAVVAERLAPRAGTHHLARRSIRMVGTTESHAEERLRPLYARWAARDPVIAATILAARGQLELQLSARSPDAAAGARRLDEAVADVQEAFRSQVYSVEGASLEAVVGALLRERAWRIALAESCTGGLVTGRLTEVAGSSAYVERGVIAYSNQAKIDLLGVPEPLIVEHGAVSEPVALAMAEGARRQAGVEVGVGVTGIAGPGGGTPEKPVGTVVFAVVAAERQRVRTALFPGSRSLVRLFATTATLDLVRRTVLDI